MYELAGLLSAFTAAVIGISSSVFAARRLLHLIWPIKVKAGIKIVFKDINQDEIKATILNRSREAQYVSRCIARSTYSLRSIIKKTIKQRRINLRPHPNTCWGPFTYDMLTSKSLKIEPFESVSVSYHLSSHPLELFLTSYLQVEVELTTERVFRSRRFRVPKRWMQESLKKIEAMKP